MRRLDTHDAVGAASSVVVIVVAVVFVRRTKLLLRKIALLFLGVYSGAGSLGHIVCSSIMFIIILFIGNAMGRKRALLFMARSVRHDRGRIDFCRGAARRVAAAFPAKRVDDIYASKRTSTNTHRAFSALRVRTHTGYLCKIHNQPADSLSVSFSAGPSSFVFSSVPEIAGECFFFFFRAANINFPYTRAGRAN